MPAACLVAEMNSGLEQLSNAYFCQWGSLIWCVDTGTPVRGTPASKGSPGQGRGRYGRVEGLVSLRKFSRVPSLGGRRPAYSLLTSDPESKEPAA